MKSKKIHWYTPHAFGALCSRPRPYDAKDTVDQSLVTCSVCRRIADAYSLQVRCSFPETPTFTVYPNGRYKTKDGYGCYLTFQCPVCGGENHHGGTFGKPGDGDGHRVSHCNCWDDGYYICEALPADSRVSLAPLN